MSRFPPLFKTLQRGYCHLGRDSRAHPPSGLPDIVAQSTLPLTEVMAAVSGNKWELLISLPPLSYGHLQQHLLVEYLPRGLHL